MLLIIFLELGAGKGQTNTGCNTQCGLLQGGLQHN